MARIKKNDSVAKLDYDTVRVKINGIQYYKSVSQPVLIQKGAQKSMFRRVMQIQRVDGGNISKKEMNAIENDLKEVLHATDDYIYTYNVVVRTIFNTYFNMKSFSDDSVKYANLDDYLAGRVKDETKFAEIDTMTFNIFIKKLKK